jgi:hypothetical protein
VVKPLKLYGELHRFIPALASEAGVRIVEQPVNHRARIHGESKYGISRTIRVVLDLMTVKFLLSYSTRPLQIFGLAGLVLGGLGAVILTWLGTGRLLGSVSLDQHQPLLLCGILLGFTACNSSPSGCSRRCSSGPTTNRRETHLHHPSSARERRGGRRAADGSRSLETGVDIVGTMSHRGQRQTFPWKVWILRAVLATTLLVLLLGVVKRIDPVKEGLTGTHFARRDAALVPIRSVVDAPPSTERIAEAWDDAPPEKFNATWQGGLLIVRSDVYTFATASDDGSHVYIDGQKVVDNGGSHAVEVRSGTVQLAAGVHSIFIDYANDGGGSLRVAVGRGSGPLGKCRDGSSPRTGSAPQVVPASPVLGLLRRRLWVGTLVAAAGLQLLSRGGTALIGALGGLGTGALGWFSRDQLVHESHRHLVGHAWPLGGDRIVRPAGWSRARQGLLSWRRPTPRPFLSAERGHEPHAPASLARPGQLRAGHLFDRAPGCRLLSVVINWNPDRHVSAAFGRSAGGLDSGGGDLRDGGAIPVLREDGERRRAVNLLGQLVFYLRVLERFERRDYAANSSPHRRLPRRGRIGPTACTLPPSS